MQIKKRRGTLKGGDTQEKKKREEDWKYTGEKILRLRKEQREQRRSHGEGISFEKEGEYV